MEEEHVYTIGEPGGPSGPFYSIVRDDGRIIALQVASEEIAERIVKGLKLLDKLERSDHDPNQIVR